MLGGWAGLAVAGGSSDNPTVLSGRSLRMKNSTKVLGDFNQRLLFTFSSCRTYSLAFLPTCTMGTLPRGDNTAICMNTRCNQPLLDCSLKAIRKASSRERNWNSSLELQGKKNVHPNHALKALASGDVILATSPVRISRKLNALREQLASAPASLQGHLHSACYEALFRSGDMTTRHHRGKLDAQALSMRPTTAPGTPRSAWRNMVQESESNTGHNTPVYRQLKHVPNFGRPPSRFNREARPSTATTAAAAAAEAAKAREKLRTAPATLYSDYEFQTSSNRCRHCAPPSGKLHHGSTLNQQPDSAAKIPLTMEEEQRRARHPIKSVTFNCKPSSPYLCKMSNQAAKKTKSYRELNFTGVTGRRGVPLDVKYMMAKAKNSVKKAGESEPPVKRSSYLRDALNISSSLDHLGEELRGQQERCARLTRTLKQQKEMLRLIKRTKGRRVLTCNNIMCEVSQFAYLGNGSY